MSAKNGVTATIATMAKAPSTRSSLSRLPKGARPRIRAGNASMAFAAMFAAFAVWNVVALIRLTRRIR